MSQDLPPIDDAKQPTEVGEVEDRPVNDRPVKDRLVEDLEPLEALDLDEDQDQPVMRESLATQIATQQFIILWHPLLTGLANSDDRSIAAEECVKQFATMLPDHTIRLGWAVERLKKANNPDEVRPWKLDKLFDSRLGWLSKDNSVFLSLSSSFANVAEDAKTIRWESANLVLELKDAHSPQHRAVMWIRPPQSDEDEVKRFQRAIPRELLGTTAAVFFSRPISGKWEQLLTVVRRWWSRRAGIGIAVLVLGALACIPTAYRVDAKATVIAMDSRRVAAPIDATLLVAHKRPGDAVRVGDPLFELDGRPLRIELEAITAEIEEATKDEDISLANGEIASAQLAGLRRQTLSRRRDLILNRLDKLVVTSPIDGIVIQGDLHHSLGSPLEIGQTLLEIAPRDSVEIELEVPEVEIGYVETDSVVKLWFPAVENFDFKTHVQRVYPSATIREDENVFIAKTPMPSLEAEEIGTDASGEKTMPNVNDVAFTMNSTASKTNGLPSDQLELAETSLRVGMRGEAVVMGPMRPWIWKWVRLPIRRLGWVVGW